MAVWNDGERHMAPTPAHRRNSMSIRKHASIAVSCAAIIYVAIGPTTGKAQSNNIGQLASSEGIFVDGKSFEIAKGQAKNDPAVVISKLNAKEVGPGAIIFRSGDKLYIAEGIPEVTPQAMKSFQDEWVSYMKNFQDQWKSDMNPADASTYKQAMKDFQDQWVNYAKNFQDDWKSNMNSKEFQDQWVSYMKNFQDQWKSNMKNPAEPQKMAMKDFQDQWSSYMKNFQDQWKSNMNSPQAMKEFQDQWKSNMK
jgi:hypothetical protein